MFMRCITIDESSSVEAGRKKGVSALIIFVTAFLLAGYFSSLHAAPDWGFEKLLMPGDLIEGHAEYEADCAQCHVSFEKSAQDRLCLDCHDLVALDVDQKTGLHGRRIASTKEGCKTCHVDHQGRQKDIVRLDTDGFDHLFTDFTLAGKHLKLSCSSCHSASEKYRDAPIDCIDCHKTSDKHLGKLGEDCASCHSEEGWPEADFDHSNTQFSLNGEHAELVCNACHPGERYKDIPEQCHSCHAVSDKHNGRYGQQCKDCHTEKSWEEIQFDHLIDTDFALLGEHKTLQCESCHRGSRLDVTQGNTCFDCHRNHDTHSGKNGEECQDCHDETAWDTIKFNHELDTEFELKGMHVELECSLCHRGALYDNELQAGCASCHAYVDVHKGKQGKQCSNCHNEKSWHLDVVFDHDLTDFPLIGLHATVPCEACHVTGSFKGIAMDCESCHKSDDEHSGALGVSCVGCHNPAGWELWYFDHSVQTDWPLEGAHENLVCNACHKQSTSDNKVRQSSTCVSCHRSDDIHAGSYGERCERCHNSDSFNDIQKLWR